MRFETNRVRSISTVLLLILLAFAPLAKAQPLPDRTTYSGQVVSETGQPIGGAAVSLRRQNEVGALAYWGGILLTDARGNFSFSNAEAGTYLLSVNADGYADIRDRFITIGGEKPVGPIQLQELAAFRVGLTDSAGAPLKSTTFALALKPVEGLGRADSYWRMVRATVDAQGNATFAGILPGRYDVLGAVPGTGYFEKKDVSLAPGNNATPFAWKLKKGGTLRILATDATGKGVGGVQISFARAGDAAADVPRQFPGPEAQIYGTRVYVTRDGDGVLEVPDLAPGQYKVTGVFPGAPVIAPQNLAVEADKTAEVKLKAGVPTPASFAVKVVDAKGVAGANGDFVFVLTLLKSTAAISGESAPVQSRIERRVRANAEGVAMLFPISPGTWQISARRDVKNVATNYGAATTTQIAAGANTAPFNVVTPD